MYLGTALLVLDAKWRLAIPARHRPELEATTNSNVIITAHPHRCLLIYPIPVWEHTAAELSRRANLEPKAAALKRLMLGHATEETLDGAGRVLLAPSQREWASIGRDVRLVGQGTHFEVWSEEGWKAQEKIMEGLAESTPEAFADMVL